MILILAFGSICSNYPNFTIALNEGHYSVSQEEYLVSSPVVWIVLRRKLCSMASDPTLCGLTNL